MSKKMTKTLAVHLLSEDFETFNREATRDRRKVADVIRNVLEDMADGKITVYPHPKQKPRENTTIRVSEDLLKKIEELKERANMSTDKLLQMYARQIAKSS